ncbi:MAG: biopolymer transporter ExbD [Planctomycetota bacterium]
MALRTSTPDELPSINLTPMIDVVFLLIIFFMVGTQFSEKERHIDLTLPGAGQLQAMIAPPDRREVSVSSSGEIYLDGAQVTLDALTGRLQKMIAQYPDLRVVVRADGTVEHQYVVTIYGAINRAGVKDMAIAARYQPGQVR